MSLGDYRERVLNDARQWKALRRNWLDVLAVASAVLTVAGLGAQVYIVSTDSQVIILVVTCVIITVLLAAFSVWMYLRALKHQRYAYAFRGIHTIAHILRDEIESRKGAKWREGDIKRCLSEVLNSLAKTFSILVGADCRACVKTLAISAPEGKAVTREDAINYAHALVFCRDSATLDLMGAVRESERDTPINSNTGFRRLFESTKNRCHIANNILKLGQQFQTTSVNKYGGSLPYNSVIIWPIRVIIREEPVPGQNHDRLGALTADQNILGYLIVDTLSKKGFDGTFDFEVGAIVADLLYTFLDRVWQEYDVAPPQPHHEIAAKATAEKGA